MKSIVCINTDLPTVNHAIDYDSDESLRDYDIIVFDPELPYYERIEFTGGGSSLSIEGAGRFGRSSLHWSREIGSALSAGKTVFVVLSGREEDQAATGYTTPAKGRRTYSTTIIDNYSIIPGGVRVRNSRGRNVVVKDPAYKGIYESIKDIVEYRVVFESPGAMKTVFAAKDGTAIGGVIQPQGSPGWLVLLPYFSFHSDGYYVESEDGEQLWTERARKASHALVGQLVSIDRMLKGSVELVPPPDWVRHYDRPKAVDAIDSAVADIGARITELERERSEQLLLKAELLEYSYLLYESGKPLERAIEKVLRLLGYTVETLQIGDLEIDHVIVGPMGIRMIGESEGKDSGAIDISKFRQLESNIGEDFERDEIDEPAKGLLFGNGFRLSAPAERGEQFTQKSLKNAKRLGSALIRTVDLYPIAVHLLDNPEDEAFRAACRAAIEETEGGVVSFPDP